MMIVEQGEQREAVPDLLCRQSTAKLPLIGAVVAKVAAGLGNCIQAGAIGG
jgi:hypothetical protein